MTKHFPNLKLSVEKARILYNDPEVAIISFKHKSDSLLANKSTDHCRNTVAVIFRGTLTPKDYFTDILFSISAEEKIPQAELLNIHRPISENSDMVYGVAAGAKIRADAHYDTILQTLNNIPELKNDGSHSSRTDLIIAGHSLGAAAARIVSIRLALLGFTVNNVMLSNPKIIRDSAPNIPATILTCMELSALGFSWPAITSAIFVASKFGVYDKKVADLNVLTNQIEKHHGKLNTIHFHREDDPIVRHSIGISSETTDIVLPKGCEETHDFFSDHRIENVIHGINDAFKETDDTIEKEVIDWRKKV